FVRAIAYVGETKVAEAELGFGIKVV
ncbi:MAG: hypothetical protein ACI9F2_000658, partial [Lysobacterales bacterium]